MKVNFWEKWFWGKNRFPHVYAWYIYGWGVALEWCKEQTTKLFNGLYVTIYRIHLINRDISWEWVEEVTSYKLPVSKCISGIKTCIINVVLCYYCCLMFQLQHQGDWVISKFCLKERTTWKREPWRDVAISEIIKIILMFQR